MHTVEGRTKQPGKAIFTQRRKELLWIYFNALGPVKKKNCVHLSTNHMLNEVESTKSHPPFIMLESSWRQVNFSGIIFTTA